MSASRKPMNNIFIAYNGSLFEQQSMMLDSRIRENVAWTHGLPIKFDTVKLRRTIVNIELSQVIISKNII